jgi:signal transduction histidine kinase
VNHRSTSLRRRFLVLAALAVIAIGSALLMIGQLFARSDGARESAALQTAEAMATALAHEASTDGAGADDAGLRRFATSVVAAQVDAHGGYCVHGALISAAGPGPRREVVPLELPPAQRDQIARACGAAGAETATDRIVHPHDVVVLAVRGYAGGAAWGVVRVSTHPDEPFLPWPLLVMAAATMALVLLTIEAVVAVRRGVVDLEVSLHRLRGDLRAELPVPRPAELARIGHGMHAMALRLAEARERERRLERDLGHEQRLAGLGRVAAGIAHEVRNPLAVLKLKLEAMDRQRDDERGRRDIAECLQEVARIDQTVGAMLLVARRAPMDRSPVDVGALVEERAAAARPLADERSVDLRREGEATVASSRTTLTRVLDNLLRNAIEASPPGGLVAVRIEQRAGDVTIDVADDGPGVPAGRTEELFEPFFTTKPEGTGLGLWLSRSLVEVGGGKLEYRRVEPRSHFTVTLTNEPQEAT